MYIFKADNKTNYKDTNRRTYSTREKAKEYIHFNKPQYSLKEIHEMISPYSYKGCLILQNIKK